MVFHGRPSRDCAPCRRRKTRCDLVSTGCSQCRRAKVTCHGYRSSNELIFRDETRNTMQKVFASQRASQIPFAPKWCPITSARHAFLSLYIGTYSRGYDNLNSFLRDSGTNGHLQVSVDAVSLAFMAFQLNRHDWIPLANQRYLEAIRGVGMVVRSSMHGTDNAANQSLSDVTLQSVLLLDLYEKMACQYHRSSESPGLLISHVRGALSILQSLPRDEFSNPTIQQLTTQSFIAFALSCAAEQIPIPEEFIGLYNSLGSYIRSGHWILIGYIIRLINLRANTQKGKLDLSDTIKLSRDLYDELFYAESNMPRSWWPNRRGTCEAVAFDRYYDVYPGHQAAQFFNAFRVIRLETAELIQQCEPSAEVAEIIAQITQAICASVPGFILPAARSQISVPLSPLQLLECSALLTPLYAAARSTQDPAMRAWVLRTLMYMANNGVKLAKSVAYVIRFFPQVSYWTVFKMVGGYSVTCSTNT